MQHLAAERFVPTSSPPPLGADEVHLWLRTLDGAPNHREVTAAAHALLTRLLVRYAGLAQAPEIARGEHGKPYAPTLPGVDFNLSHARDHVLIAIARNQPVGVDLERIDRRIETQDLSRRFFARAEADALDALPEAARLPAFLRLWTCKEAVLKAIGEGIGFGLDKVAFALDGYGMPDGPAHIATEAGPREEWQVALLEPAAGFLGALAWCGPPRHIRAFLAGADA